MDTFYEVFVPLNHFVVETRRDFWIDDTDPGLAVTITGSIIFPIICSVGIFGNSISFLVLCRKELKGSNFVYLSVLAFNNVCNCISIIITGFSGTILVNSKFPIYFLIYGTPLMGFFNTMSVLTTVTVSCETCVCLLNVAKCNKPLRKKTRMAKKTVCGFVLFSIIFNIPSCLIFEYNFDTLIVNPFYFTPFYNFYVWFTFVFMGIIPTFFLSVANTFMFYKLKKIMRHRMKMNDQKKIYYKKYCANKTIVLIMIVFFFLIMEIPTLMFSRTSAGRIFYNNDDMNVSNIPEADQELNTIRLISGILDSIILALYFFVYYLFCPQFKIAFLKMIRNEKNLDKRHKLSRRPDVKMNIFVINANNDNNNTDKLNDMTIDLEKKIVVDLPNPEKFIEILQHHNENHKSMDGDDSSLDSSTSGFQSGGENDNNNNLIVKF